METKVGAATPNELEETKVSPLRIVRNYLTVPNLPFSFEKRDPMDVLDRILPKAGEIRSLFQGSATKDQQTETPFDRGSWKGPFTGKEEEISVGIQRGKFKLGDTIGMGAEGDVYDCELSQGAKSKFPLVVKVIRPDSATRKEYVKGSLMNPFTTVAMHANDEVPVLPRCAGMAEIEGNPAMVMEKIKASSLVESVKDKPMEEKDAVGGILPLVKFLVFEQKQGFTLRDNKMTDVRVGTQGEGISAHPYFRLIDFGVSKIQESDKKRDLQAGFTSVGQILLFSLMGQDAQITELVGPDERKAQNTLNKISTDDRFRRLTPATQYVILKTLGKTPDHYANFSELEDDLALIDAMPVIAGGGVDKNTHNFITILGTRGSDPIVGRALKLNFYEKSSEKQKLADAVSEDAEKFGAEMTRLCAPPPPETIEEKNKRLDKHREFLTYILNVVQYGHTAELDKTGGMIDEYLKERPKDKEVQYWGWLAQALDVVWKTDLMLDPKFKESYLALCQSLQTDSKSGRKEFIPLEELKVRAQPILDLQKMILGVLNAQK